MTDRPVLVVDLRAEALDEDRRLLETDETAPTPPDAPLGPTERVEAMAVLHDGNDSPLLLPIEPTRDRAALDALARLLRFAVLRGERIPTVAVRHGEERERRLAFTRTLPRWAYEGVADADLGDAPPAIRRVLARRDRA